MSKEVYGYKMYAPRSGSSHYTFRKAGRDSITIPKHVHIKKSVHRNGQSHSRTRGGQ